MVATSITMMLMLMLSFAFSSISRAWTHSAGRVGMFSAARAGFEAMSRNLSQSTLNTYLSYANANGEPVPLINPSFKPAGATLDRTQVPVRYERMSELHFVTAPADELLAQAGFPGMATPGHAVFFQAPTGHVADPDSRPKETLLNVLGYYVEFASDESFRPQIVNEEAPPKYRYRLMEVIQPAEENGIYASTCEVDPVTNLARYVYDLRWVQALSLTGHVAPKHPLADNVIMLALMPKLSPLESPDPTDLVGARYEYDSRKWEASAAADPRMRNQLPPLVELIMVAIDETSAERLAAQYGGSGGDLPPFENGAVRSIVDLGALFRAPSQREADIDAIGDGLAELGAGYRVFRTDLSIHGAKWSGD